MSGGYLSGRYLSGGICPAGICPDTGICMYTNCLTGKPIVRFMS